MKTTMRIFALLAAMLMLSGCVVMLGEDRLPETKPTLTQETEPARTEAATEAAPAPTEKPCVHEWMPDESRPHTATCREAGEEYFLCKLCGAKKAEEKPATGHYWENVNYVSGDCSTGITYHQRCLTCGAQRNKTGEVAEHTPDWENPGRVQQPTCTADGFRYAYCTVCGARAKEVLPATGHTFGENGSCACGETQ